MMPSARLALQLEEARRRPLCLARMRHDFGQMGFYQPAQSGHVGVVRLAGEQQTAELILHFSNSARQGLLAHMSFFRCLGEIERPAHRQKIANLLHFHPDHPFWPLPPSTDDLGMSLFAGTTVVLRRLE
ncbi:MAG: hypothetical protein WCB44_02025 [Stellaceae bacterium]